MAHRTDEASVVPAEPQRLQEPVPSIDLEVTAAALGAKHLLVVCEERQSPGQHSLAPQPLIQGSRAGAQPGAHRHSLGTTRCQPRGHGARDTRVRCLCRTEWPRLPPRCREEANLISQDAALAFDVHPPSSPWQHGSTALPGSRGGQGWRAQACRRGVPAFPMAQGEPLSAWQLTPHACGQLLSPNSAWCPRAMGGVTHGVPGSYLSRSRAAPPPCRRHGYGWEFCRRRT